MEFFTVCISLNADYYTFENIYAVKDEAVTAAGKATVAVDDQHDI